MAYVYQGHIEKIPILEEILADAKIDPSEVAYMGDDFTDVVIMQPRGPGDRDGQCARRSEEGGALRDAGSGRRGRRPRSGGIAAQGAEPLGRDSAALRNSRVSAPDWAATPRGAGSVPS